MSSYSLLMFRRNSSSWTALMDIWGLMALFRMGLVAGLFFSWPFSMATRGLWGLLISLIFNIIITLCPLLLLLLLHYFFFTPFGIGGRRVTPSWSGATLRAFLPQGFLHGPQSGGVVPSLGPPLGGGLLISTADLHPHHLDRQKDMKVRDDQKWRYATLVV
jgi:hypothetical protein